MKDGGYELVIDPVSDKPICPYCNRVMLFLYTKGIHSWYSCEEDDLTLGVER